MGFGTGHHATTRLCLEALQDLDLRGRTVLDVGTGSGILAIAARLLGAAAVIGVDDDRDAIAAAVENLGHNPRVSHVQFEVRDIRIGQVAPADVVTANLTGALLTRIAAVLQDAVSPGGSLIVSGLQQHERDDVVQKFGRAQVVWERQEDEWIGIVFRTC
jgi:ribosomal protein L11 methyltransferase